jgi:tRNA A58 N-methylase Trm61
MHPSAVGSLLVMLLACRNPASAEIEQRDTRREILEREQARFDAERHPELVVQALHIGPGSKVADIGAATGLFTVHLANAVKPNGHVVATDINKSVLDLLQSRVAAVGLDDLVDQRVVTGDKPGLEPGTYDSIVPADVEEPDDERTEVGTYDAILLSEVDHLFADEAAWLAQATPALSRGGRIVITNRMHHRRRTMAAARRAGLVLASESSAGPTHFIAVFIAK